RCLFSLPFYCSLVLYLRGVRAVHRLCLNRGFFLFGSHRAFQHHGSAPRNHFDIVGIGGEALVVCKRFSDFPREITISLVFGLLLGGSGAFIAVLLVGLAIVGSLSKRRRARDRHAESCQDYGGLAFLQNCSIS